MVGFIHIAGGSTIIIESTMPPKKASFNSAASVASAASRAPGKRKLNDLVPDEFDAEKEIEVGRKGGASKKGRQEGQEDRQEGQASARTICLLCQKKPGKDVEWAHHLQQSPGGPLHPSGNQCFQCLLFHTKNFPHLSWSDFGKFIETEPGQTAVNQAKKSAMGGHRDFVLDSVSAVTTVSMRIERPMIVMNEREYKNYFNKPPPSVRGPKVPTLTLPKESNPGETEKVWCFEDPSMPMRRCTMVTEIGDKRQQQRLDPQDRLGANQSSNHLRIVSC